MFSRQINRLLVVAVILLLQACGGSAERDGPPARPPNQSDIARTPDAIPRHEKPNPANQKPYTIRGKTYYPLASNHGFVQRGIASWYGKKFHGRRTANGEIYNMYAMTAAHTRLPLPTYVRVRNLANGRSVIVRVNDRGPFVGNRAIDLSYAAAVKLGFMRQGTAQVEISAINAGDIAATPPFNPDKASRLYLQVGAFFSQQHAQKLRDDIQRKIQQAIVIQTNYLYDNPVYRVQVGPLPSTDHAEQLARTLQNYGFGEPQIVLR